MTYTVATDGSNCIRKDSYAQTALAKIRALRGGATAMRRAGKSYLPQREQESEADYATRLERSWLDPMLDDSIRRFADMLFTKPMTVTEESPEQYQAWAKNITNDGQGLSEFAREVAEDAIEAGISFVLVDSPRVEAGLSIADVEAANIRPFLTHIRVEEIIGFKVETVANVTRLKQVRLAETEEIESDNPWETTEVNQVRVLERQKGGNVRVQIWREESTTGTTGPSRQDTPAPKVSRSKGEYTLVDEFETGLADITLVPLYTNRTSFMRGYPLLEALADLNIEHWQKASNKTIGEAYALTPILYAAGFEDGDMTLSNGSFIRNSNADAKLAWVSAKDLPLAEARETLKGIERRAAKLGLDLVMPSTAGAVTATEKSIDSATSKVPLSRISHALKSTFNQALEYMGRYAGIEPGTVEVFEDFSALGIGAKYADYLLKARQSGAISKETFLVEGKRIGMLAENLDIADEIERLDDEIADPVNASFTLEDESGTVGI